MVGHCPAVPHGAGSVQFHRDRKCRRERTAYTATYIFVKDLLSHQKDRGESVVARRSFYNSRQDTRCKARRVLMALGSTGRNLLREMTGQRTTL